MKPTSGPSTVKKAKEPVETSTPKSVIPPSMTLSNPVASSGSGNVKVVCRIRPINKKEMEIGGPICVDFVDDMTINLRTSQSSEAGAGNHKFAFDRVFKMNVSQEDVYDFAAKPVVNSVLEGFNGTVFAYGQTSSGKTHTMQGPSIDDPQMRGIIPRMVNTVFEHIGTTPEHIEFTVKVSIVEIYLEKIRDLLSPEKSNLKVREDKARGIYLEDVTESYVSDDKEVFDLMKLGASNRAISATNMNEGSSRSHSIFMLTVNQNNLHELSAKTGKLYLVDLAGSEKVGKTGAAGQLLEEAKNINKSLSALGNVINALTDAKSHQHIPYRDSKLTRILQESLGGNARTTLIITCSPSPFNDQETLSTLRFGYRAKSIKNTPKINREFTVPELKLLLDKAEQNLELKEKRIKVLENILISHGIPLPKDKEVEALLVQAVKQTTTPTLGSTEGTEVASESDSEDEKKTSKDANHLSLLTRDDDQGRIKLLESELEMERNNVRTQTEKVNILRKEFAAIASKLSTSERENEIIITKLASLTVKIQEFEDKGKGKDEEFVYFQNITEKLIRENDELKRIKEENDKTIEEFQNKQNHNGELPQANSVQPSADLNGAAESSFDIVAEQMMKELAAKFNIQDEAALKVFANSYLDKFKANGQAVKAKGDENNNNQRSEELIAEKEKNSKLQSDYDKLKEEYELLKSQKASEASTEAKTQETQPDEAKNKNGSDMKAEQEEKKDDKTAEESKSVAKPPSNFQKNLDQITNMYHNITLQNAQIKPDSQSAPDKKVHRKTDRILNLEKQLHETKDLVNAYKSKIESLKSLISISSSNTSVTSAGLSMSEKQESSEQIRQKKESLRQEMMDKVSNDPKNLDDVQLRTSLGPSSFTKIVKHIRGGGQATKKPSITGQQFINVLKQPNVYNSSPHAPDSGERKNTSEKN